MSGKDLLENIKKLREMTGVGFKDCKAAKTIDGAVFLPKGSRIIEFGFISISRINSGLNCFLLFIF